MPVPFEALIPFGLLTVMFGATGTLFSVVKRAQNDWKPPRYNLDAWDTMMMERDRRLTGSARGQSGRANVAPTEQDLKLTLPDRADRTKRVLDEFSLADGTSGLIASSEQWTDLHA